MHFRKFVIIILISVLLLLYVTSLHSIDQSVLVMDNFITNIYTFLLSM